MHLTLKLHLLSLFYAFECFLSVSPAYMSILCVPGTYGGQKGHQVP